MRATKWIFCIIACLMEVACMRTAGSPSASSALPDRSTPRSDKIEPYEKVVKTSARLRRSDSSPWQATESLTAGGENLRSVYFFDAAHGWVGGAGALYQTVDSGTTWQPVKLEISPKAFVGQIVFSDLNNGWVVIQEKAESALREYQDNRFRLMRTLDGGQTWRVELDKPHSVFERLRVNTIGDGWLVGRTYLTANSTESQNFIFHSSNAGAQWLDVADPLNALVRTGNLGGPLTDVVPGDPLTARVLSNAGFVFETTDGGEHWRQLTGALDDDICSCQFGFLEGQDLWVGGEMTGRLTRGMVAIREGALWKEYVLWYVLFHDIMFISRTQILTAGSTTPNQTSETDKREAVISYSSDGGKSWAFIYHNAKVSRINALAAIDSDHIWAVGDGGVILRLTATTKD